MFYEWFNKKQINSLKMKELNVKRFGLALGLTGVIFYLGCILVMYSLGEEMTVKFFNNLLHGADFTHIVRMDIPVWEACLGIIQTFIIGWLAGACIAVIYNFSAKSN